jgi:tetratricopeptide (TPR) repeat protein
MAARAAARDAETDLEAHWKLANLEEAAEDPTAEEEWRLVLGMIEAQLRKTPDNPSLLERQVEAMVGANVAVRVVPQAEKLAKLQPGNWRSQLLLGDAYLRRADFNWRVLVKVGRGGKGLAAPQLLQMNDDLRAAERAYVKSVDAAPDEAAPRAARISLTLARPVMAAMLPKGALEVTNRPDLSGIWNELLELVRRNPGQVEPLWHAAHYLATQSTAETLGTPADRKLLLDALAGIKTAGDAQLLGLEVRGLLAVDRKDWNAARQAFEAAAAAQPERRFAADWLALAEVNSCEPRDQIIARVRARMIAHPSSQDATVLGVLLAGSDRPAAIESLRKAIELDRDSAVARYNLAILLAQQDPASPEVRYHLQRALQLQPDDREAVFSEAVLEALAGHEKAARQVLEGFLKTPDLEPNLKLRVQQTLQDLPAAKG